MKKLVSVLLAAAVALSSALMMTGCEEQEYPVSIANYTIEKEPENVVVLDPITADIMAYMDFERKFAGRSKAVTQPELKAAPVVGTEENPDIDQIVTGPVPAKSSSWNIFGVTSSSYQDDSAIVP